MKVVELPIDKVLPYWHNPRKNEKTVERLIKSIKDYGFNVPLVVNKDMILITGHARLKAAKKMGLETVPCVLVDLTDEQAKKYRIADNKIQESSEWEEEALFKELREIGDPLELIDMGFDSKDVEEIIGNVDDLVREVTEFTPTPTYVQTSPVEQGNVSPLASVEPRRIEVVPIQGGDQQSVQDTPKPIVITAQVNEEDLMEKIKKREQELSGRFVQESIEQKRFNNYVICPHCGEEFMIRN